MPVERLRRPEVNPATLHPKIAPAAAALAHMTICGWYNAPANGSDARAASHQLHSHDQDPLKHLELTRFYEVRPSPKNLRVVPDC